MAINQLSNKIIGAAIEVHKTLGPGLLESTYGKCLCYELKISGFFAFRPLTGKQKEMVPSAPFAPLR
jgi:hypothetical protein